MIIRLIASDLDGTMLMDDHASISPVTRQTLCTAIACGIYIIPATGRFYGGIPESVLKINGLRYCIASNGAVVYDILENRRLREALIPKDVVETLLPLLHARGIFFELYSKDQSLVLPTLEYPDAAYGRTVVEELPSLLSRCSDTVEKIDIPKVEPIQRVYLDNVLAQYANLSPSSSFSGQVELNAAGVNKGSALAWLCQELEVPAQAVMAIGDNCNDVEMLEFAGLSVAMGNSVDSLKMHAHDVTDTVQNNGMAKAVEKFVLSRI